MAHALKIDSLHDAQARCSCGKWSYLFTGSRTRKQIEDQHNLHLARAASERAAKIRAARLA